MFDDRLLVRRLQQGDRDALRIVYEQYKQDLLTIATCITTNRTDAEDCLHDVFVSLAINRTHVRNDGNLKGYLIASIANRARDRLRAKKRRPMTGESDDRQDLPCAVKGTDPTATLVAEESNERLYAAMAELPEEQRTVMTLRLHGDLTFEEIGQMEGVSGNTIRSRYRYGLEMLRSLLGAGVER
jgi:RNA polymerase sigma factor (sigma-70 family)